MMRNLNELTIRSPSALVKLSVKPGGAFVRFIPIENLLLPKSFDSSDKKRLQTRFTSEASVGPGGLFKTFNINIKKILWTNPWSTFKLLAGAFFIKKIKISVSPVDYFYFLVKIKA